MIADNMAPTEKAPLAAFARVLRRHRLEKRLSINELARAASISKSNLSRLEAGDGNPSLETLWALSEALGINVSELLASQATGNRVIRSDAILEAFAERAEFAVKLLSTSPAGAIRDIYRASFQPGTEKVSEAHAPGTIEHIVLLSGRARVGPIGASTDLHPGDYLSFCADQRHCYEALEPDTKAIVIMESR